MDSSSGNTSFTLNLHEPWTWRATPDWLREHQVMHYGFGDRPWIVADVKAELAVKADTYLDALKRLAGERQRRRWVYLMAQNGGENLRNDTGWPGVSFE